MNASEKRVADYVINLLKRSAGKPGAPLMERQVIETALKDTATQLKTIDEVETRVSIVEDMELGLKIEELKQKIIEIEEKLPKEALNAKQ